MYILVCIYAFTNPCTYMYLYVCICTYEFYMCYLCACMHMCTHVCALCTNVHMPMLSPCTWLPFACPHCGVWIAAWAWTWLGAHPALRMPSREPKAKVWSSKTGLPPPEWKAGGGAMLPAWFLGMLS